MNLRGILRQASFEQLQEALTYQRTDAKREKLEQEKAALLRALAKVERKLSRLDGASGNGSAPAGGMPKGRRRRKGYKVSAATRAKMRAAALRRYGKSKPEASAPGKRKRKPLGPEARAKMAAAARARSAKVKGQSQ